MFEVLFGDDAKDPSIELDAVSDRDGVYGFVYHNGMKPRHSRATADKLEKISEERFIAYVKRSGHNSLYGYMKKADTKAEAAKVLRIYLVTAPQETALVIAKDEATARWQTRWDKPMVFHTDRPRNHLYKVQSQAGRAMPHAVRPKGPGSAR